MATVFANYGFNQNNLNLNRLYANSVDGGLLDNAFLSYNDQTYQDLYIVDWYLGGYYGSVFGGDYISVDAFQTVTGGVVNGYLELVWNGAEYVELWGIEGISISAKSLYIAATTPSTLDDYSLINQALTGSDLFWLSNEADVAFGKGGNDWLYGYAGNDRLFGDEGNDSIVGGLGNDYIAGGAGTDTAIYSGNQASHTLTLSPTTTTIMDRRANGNGTDTLIDMELLDFDTGTFSLNQFGGTTGLSEQNFESFIELYIAYFNRAPDAVGLNFWGTAFANGTSLEEMATLFINQDETLAAYPAGTSNSVFAETVFENVLGRTPDQGGLDFWVGALDAGDVSRDQFILEVLRGAKSDLKPELGQEFVDQQLVDREFLTNKTDIGAYFSVHKGMSDVDNASAAMALFDGTEASIDASVAAIDGYYAEALDPTTGEFLMQVVGVLDDPFAVV